MSHMLVDEETLETLTYERSKIWSNFLKRCEETEDGEAIDLDQIEELYKEEGEESICAVEEAEEDDVEDDIKNTTACMTKSELTLMLCSGDNKEILNQTLPIVEEHVRKWKAAGLDRILNTFDAQKIEQHVGEWLRRHNSAYGELSPAKTCHKRYKPVDHLYSPDVSNESETESMHSVDTARYIRDSRKRTVSTATKCSSSPMTTIKMYRNLPHKRDELRAKYGCDEYNEEQEHRHHMQALLHRRNQRAHRRKREREHIYHTSPRHYPYSAAASFHGQQRRKQLRKRRDSSPLFQTSSSSEDERSHSRCDCSACVRRAFSKTTYPYCSYRSYRSHSHSLYHQRLESRSSHSVYKRSVRELRRQHACEGDLRPRLLESDCNCCDNDRLCSKVVHIANSSTEEWLVENRSSPDLVQFNSPKHCPLTMTNRSKPLKQPLMPKIQTTIRPSCILDKAAEEDSEEELEGKTVVNLHQLPESEPKKTTSLVTFLKVEEELKQKPYPKTTPAKSPSVSTSKQDVKKRVLPSTSSLPEIKEIKEPVETNSNVDEAAIIPKVSSHKKPLQKLVENKKVTKVKKKTTSYKANITSDESFSDKNFNKSKQSKANQMSTKSSDSDENLKRALALSKKSYLAERQKHRQQGKVKSDAISLALGSSLPQIPEQSSFNNQSVACNSTAIPNDTASARALKTAKKPQTKRVSAVASTSQTVINLDSSDSVSTLSNCWNQSDGDADCTVVTSTTSCEPAAAVAKPNAVAQRPNIKLTTRGILLYEPSDQTQSFRSGSGNGNFTLTEHSLSHILGVRRARKLLKYHVGSRSFDSRYPVYYRPTAKLAAVLSADANTIDYQSSSSSSSDDDVFDQVYRYGEVYTVQEKGSKGD